MAGFEVTKQGVNQDMGTVVLQVRESLGRVLVIKRWLDRQTDAALAELGFLDGEIAVIRSAFGDLARLAAVSAGAATQDETSDFFFWAGQLTGVSGSS